MRKLKHKQTHKVVLSHIRRKRHHYLRGVYIAGAVVAVLLVAWGGWKVIDAKRIAKSPARQAEQTIGRVQKLVVLPHDETPAVVTVVDKNKIKNIPFLEHSAENGDRILVYSKAKKVILYRPGDNKIVDIGPVSIAQPPKDAK